MREDHHALAVGNEVAPLSPARPVERCGHELEIFGPVRVREDEEPVAVMLHGIAELRRARLDDARRGVRIVPVEEMDFGCLVIARDDLHESAGLRLAEMDEEARVAFLVDEFVLLGRRPEPVAAHAHRTVILIELHVVETGCVGDPHHLPGRVRDDIVELGSRLEVPDPDGEILRSLRVGAPGQQPVIGRMLRSAQIEERKSFALLVAVEQDGFRSALPWLSPDERVLAALAEAGEIGIRPVRLRNGGIVLLDAPAHFLHEAFAQALRSFERGCRIGVLGIEMGADVGRERARVLQHGPPVLRLQPGIGILHLRPEQREDMRPRRGHGGGRKRALGQALQFHRVAPGRPGCREMVRLAVPSAEARAGGRLVVAPGPGAAIRKRPAGPRTDDVPSTT